ncbi:peptidylprolyl isomerase [Candidatus Nitrosacidococcus tergens]|uniref:peptidylprolyl isomerase n=1 Tax=Candidatus Nitrosacidococcus tergens TaxID=553981 RepID=A0A7G1Q7E1_9GAMM|nr:peptidylprolyl isomerase [Candidatus Nitrosacidococcus tergens]CAB1274335.1 PpiC-type peptidyl-prolyl cis-trans isomerase [Candidatus Nitrosacidococcus tergens]
MKIKKFFYSLGITTSLYFYTNANAVDNQKIIPFIEYKNITITPADFRAALAGYPYQYREEIAQHTKQVNDIINHVFLYRVLAQEARDLKLEQDPEVQKQIQIAIETALGKARLNLLRQQALAKDPDYETLAKEQYQANKDQYQLPAQVEVAHIIIKPKEESEVAEKQASQLAEKVRTIALEKKQPFSDLALEYSQDPSVKENKGDVGWISKGDTVPSFEEAAFDLEKIGDISPVVKTKYGYHIISLKGRKPARLQSFTEVKDRLIQGIKTDYKEQITQQHIEAINKAKEVEVNYEAINEFIQSMKQKNKDSNS